MTVRGAIGDLSKPGSSGDWAQDYVRNHSQKVLQMLGAIPKDGGSRSDLPKRLTLECHSKQKGFNDVYGRMKWDDVAPTITTGCTNASKGRFVHPEEDRAITLREAALLQGFPKNYKFEPAFGIEANSLMIGNALPPPFIKNHAKMLFNR
jgi:DNA (cytosine-5)-methyltransferase 1